MNNMNKIPDISADDDAWTIAEGNVEGRPLLIRIRPDLVNFQGVENFPMKLTIRWTYGDDHDSGMPSDQQSEEMRNLEDDLVAEFEREDAGVLAYIYTACGMREWHFYFADIEIIQTAINAATNGKPKMPLEIEADEDPDWSEHMSLAKTVSSGDSAE